MGRMPLHLPAIPGLYCLKRDRTPSDASWLEAEHQSRFSASAGRRLLCSVCEEPITAEGFRISIAGGQLHTRTNPSGQTFEFGCFEEAPGAATLGAATTEFCWFAGYSWVFAVCGGCGEQLGWRFQGGDPPLFHGLICECLVPEQEAPPPM